MSENFADISYFFGCGWWRIMTAITTAQLFCRGVLSFPHSILDCDVGVGRIDCNNPWPHQRRYTLAVTNQCIFTIHISFKSTAAPISLNWVVTNEYRCVTTAHAHTSIGPLCNLIWLWIHSACNRHPHTDSDSYSYRRITQYSTSYRERVFWMMSRERSPFQTHLCTQHNRRGV